MDNSKYIQNALIKQQARKCGNRIALAVLFMPIISYAGIFIIEYVLISFGVTALLKDPLFLVLISTILSAAAMILGTVYLVKGDHKTAEVLRFNTPKKGTFIKAVLVGLGGGAVANIATNIFINMLKSVGITPKMPDITMPAGGFGIAAYIILIAVMPALCEELLFRGGVLYMASKYGKWPGIIISSMFFALLHGNFYQIPYAFMLGIIIAYMVIETGSIFTGIAIHFANNFVSVIIEIFEKHASEELASAVALLIFAVEIILGIVATVLFFTKKEKEDKTESTRQEGGIKNLIFAPLSIVFYCYTVFEILLTQLLG